MEAIGVSSFALSQNINEHACAFQHEAGRGAFEYTSPMCIRKLSMLILAIALGYFSTLRGAAQGSSIPVLASNGIKAALEELQPQCERAIGQSLRLQYSSTAALKKRIEMGEEFDVTVISAEAIAELIKEGKIEGHSRTDVARSELGIGIRKGAAKPDISTPDALKRSLLAAKSITYPRDGATRPDIEKMFESLGIAADVKPKIILAPSSGAATESVAKGGAELVLTLFSEIVPVAGTEILGPLPGRFRDGVRFQAALSTATKNAKTSRLLIACLAGSQAAQVYKNKGLEPLASK